MKGYIRLAALSILLAAIGGCATAPIMQDAQTAAADAAIAFGSVEIYVDDEKLKLGFTWSGESHFFLLILPPDSSVATTYEVTNEGSFYWALPPGEYLLLGYRWQLGGKALSNDVRGRFTVPDSGEDVYLGSLEFRGTERYLRPNLLDRYEQSKSRYDERFPERRKTVSRRLLEPPRQLGSFTRVLPACHASFEIECSDRFRGLTPTSPDVATQGFPLVQSLQPTFEWQGSSRPDARYDLVVYEAAAYTINKVTDFYTRGRVAAYAEDLATASWRPDKPLKPGTRYFWSVRSRDGDIVSDWTTQTYFSFALVAWSSGYGQWFQFQTP